LLHPLLLNSGDRGEARFVFVIDREMQTETGHSDEGNREQPATDFAPCLKDSMHLEGSVPQYSRVNTFGRQSASQMIGGNYDKILGAGKRDQHNCIVGFSEDKRHTREVIHEVDFRQSPKA